MKQPLFYYDPKFKEYVFGVYCGHVNFKGELLSGCGVLGTSEAPHRQYSYRLKPKQQLWSTVSFCESCAKKRFRNRY